MSEILNLEAIEQQRILITVSLTGSDGAPVSPSDYVICAAAIGQPNPYTQRAVRKEWAASINNENSASLLTCPGLDMAGAPWKYRILLKNRALELEWQIVSGRISLTPRACGTDGVSPAAYTVACEATPSGLVNVTLDATVGSISTTLEAVKASAAAAAAAAQNAHADLEDSEAAATKASQAALAAAADARIASDKATAAEAAATAAPEACAPYVQQTQQAAAAALEASRTATTAAAEAQASAAAAASAQGYATRAEAAQAAAVQAAETATTAATTATQQADAATAQAESARLAATTASTASDNAQSAATRAEDAAARAEAATPAADRAESARDAAEAAASTATTAAADLPGLVQRAETAATASEAAQTAAETAQSNAETAATTATQQAAAAAASATQADTDARACAVYDQRVAANATAAADSATAAADSATAAAASATAAAESAASVDVFAIAAQIAAGTASMDDGIITAGAKANNTTTICAVKNYASVNSTCDYLIIHGDSVNIKAEGTKKCVFSDSCKSKRGDSLFGYIDEGFVHLPKIENIGTLFSRCKANTITFSDATKFENVVDANRLFVVSYGRPLQVNWANGTTFSAVKNGEEMFRWAKAAYSDASFMKNGNLPDTITFENLENAKDMFYMSGVRALPAAMVLRSLTNGKGMFYGCPSLEIEDLVRVCLTINDLQALETPKTGSLGLPASCKHNGETVDTQVWLNANHPDFLVTLNARGWTVTFA